jgi:hypothetical protein
MMATLGEDMLSRDELVCRSGRKGSTFDGAHWGAIGLVFVVLHVRVGIGRLCHRIGGGDGALPGRAHKGHDHTWRNMITVSMYENALAVLTRIHVVMGQWRRADQLMACQGQSRSVIASALFHIGSFNIFTMNQRRHREFRPTANDLITYLQFCPSSLASPLGLETLGISNVKLRR